MDRSRILPDSFLVQTPRRALGSLIWIPPSISAVEIPKHWANLPRLNLVVSIDSLQQEHDAHRKPATYERVLKNLGGASATIHCTITGQIADRPHYLEDFLHFWSARPDAKKVWMSIFTPQFVAEDPEIFTPEVRSAVVTELQRLRPLYPILDMHESCIEEFRTPPKSPGECIFARATHTVSADLKTAITPCQFGGNPDCSQCGCIASMGLAAVGHHKVAGNLTAGRIFMVSDRIGSGVRKLLDQPRKDQARRAS